MHGVNNVYYTNVCLKYSPNGPYGLFELSVEDKGRVYFLLSLLCVLTLEPDVCNVCRNLSNMSILVGRISTPPVISCLTNDRRLIWFRKKCSMAKSDPV